MCVRFSVEASRNALAANAPEEVLRVVDVALPSAASPQERLDLLEARDRAFDMLRRPTDRLEGLAELGALAEALGNSHLELDVRLRRAAALRTAEEYDRAAELAREVRPLAKERGDAEAELAACMELGQDLIRATAGESFTPAAREVDLDGAEDAFRAAVELARAAGDDATLAAALREIAVVLLGRIRAWFVEQVRSAPTSRSCSAWPPASRSTTSCPSYRSRRSSYETHSLLQQALEIFERLGDRRGAMASIIALGYLSWAADIHLGSGSARHIEEIRRLTSTAKAFTNESERAAFEAQMLFGVHVFARAKLIPDLALSRGEQASEHAREMGDRSLEFAAAGGTAMSHLDLGEVAEAAPWIERAAAIASEHPTPLRARRLETWRGMAAARRRRRGRDADAPRAGRAARRRLGPAGGQVRVARPPRAGGIATGRRGRTTPSSSTRPSGRRTRRRSWRPRCPGTRRGARRRRRRWRGSPSREAARTRPPTTPAPRSGRCSWPSTRTRTWTSRCRSRTRSPRTRSGRSSAPTCNRPSR